MNGFVDAPETFWLFGSIQLMFEVIIIFGSGLVGMLIARGEQRHEDTLNAEQ
jgi:hypothetical protein